MRISASNEDRKRGNKSETNERQKDFEERTFITADLGSHFVSNPHLLMPSVMGFSFGFFHIACFS